MGKLTWGFLERFLGVEFSVYWKCWISRWLLNCKEATVDAKQFEILSQKLDTIISLLTTTMLDGKSKTESIHLLIRSGFDNTKVADLTGSTPKAVSVRKAEAKKPKPSKRAKKDKASKGTTKEDGKEDELEVATL